MKPSTPSRKSASGTTITTVFVSGNSQAVRLPKEFRVNTKTVEISKRGEEIILREHARTVGETLADLPALSQEQSAEFDQFISQAKAGLSALEERDFSWMDAPAAAGATPRKRRATAVRTKPRTKG